MKAVSPPWDLPGDNAVQEEYDGRMDIHLHRAYDLQDHRRHAIGMRSRTCCGLSRAHVRATNLEFHPDDFFACPECAAAYASSAA